MSARASVMVYALCSLLQLQSCARKCYVQLMLQIGYPQRTVVRVLVVHCCCRIFGQCTCHMVTVVFAVQTFLSSSSCYPLSHSINAINATDFSIRILRRNVTCPTNEVQYSVLALYGVPQSQLQLQSCMDTGVTADSYGLSLRSAS
jgi:hypothetical protein